LKKFIYYFLGLALEYPLSFPPLQNPLLGISLFFGVVVVLVFA